MKKYFIALTAILGCLILASCGSSAKKALTECPICHKPITPQTVLVETVLVENGEDIVMCQQCYAFGRRFGKVW